MSIGDNYSFPAALARSPTVEDFNPAEWTRCLVYDGTPGTRNCPIPSDVTEVLLMLVGGGQAGGAALGSTVIADGGQGGGLFLGIVPVTPGSLVSYTVAAGGAAVTRTTAGATTGTAGGTTSFGAFVSVTTVPSVSLAKQVLAATTGGTAGAASGTYAAATGGGSAGSPWGNGKSSGTAVSTASNGAASGGAGPLASSGAASSNVTGGGGIEASTGPRGGGPTALMTDVVEAYTASPPVPASALLQYLLTGGALADAVPTALNHGWNTIATSAGRSGGSGNLIGTALSPGGTNTGKAGDGGHFAGGGAAAAQFSVLSAGDHTVRGGNGGRFGGGGGAALEANSSVSGGTVNVIGGDGRWGGGGGGAAALSGSPATCNITSGKGGDGLVAVFARVAP